MHEMSLLEFGAFRVSHNTLFKQIYCLNQFVIILTNGSGSEIKNGRCKDPDPDSKLRKLFSMCTKLVFLRLVRFACPNSNTQSFNNQFKSIIVYSNTLLSKPV